MLVDLRIRIDARKSVASPFLLLGAADDAALHSRCAQHFAESQLVGVAEPRRRTGLQQAGKIKVAYLSGDFCRHAIGSLTAGLFEQHDRSRFEVVGISYSPDDQSDIRARILKGFDHFYDVRSQDDAHVADLIRNLGVDIAVDLAGYTTGARSEILARRPAPIQVNYLGYPGTMGADFIDYILADPTILPFSQEPFFSEKIVHLPDCYQVNDGARMRPSLSSGALRPGCPSMASSSAVSIKITKSRA